MKKTAKIYLSTHPAIKNEDMKIMLGHMMVLNGKSECYKDVSS